MMLRHSLGLEDEAKAIEQAVERALTSGHRTADLAAGAAGALNTAAMCAAILANMAG
jgi:3-isopropylmalate dehydrogenase